MNAIGLKCQNFENVLKISKSRKSKKFPNSIKIDSKLRKILLTFFNIPNRPNDFYEL